MMQMTDFTRGTGPLKSTSDVIESARNIAKLGNDLDALASQIAEVIFDNWFVNHKDTILSSTRIYGALAKYIILGMSWRLGPKRIICTYQQNQILLPSTEHVRESKGWSTKYCWRISRFRSWFGHISHSGKIPRHNYDLSKKVPGQNNELKLIDEI